MHGYFELVTPQNDFILWKAKYIYCIFFLNIGPLSLSLHGQKMFVLFLFYRRNLFNQAEYACRLHPSVLTGSTTSPTAAQNACKVWVFTGHCWLVLILQLGTVSQCEVLIRRSDQVANAPWRGAEVAHYRLLNKKTIREECEIGSRLHWLAEEKKLC